MGNSYKVEILAQEVIAKFWSTLSKVTLNYTRRDGRSEILVREVNDHGHAAAVLALDPARKTVLLGQANAHCRACGGIRGCHDRGLRRPA